MNLILSEQICTQISSYLSDSGDFVLALHNFTQTYQMTTSNYQTGLCNWFVEREVSQHHFKTQICAGCRSHVQNLTHKLILSGHIHQQSKRLFKQSDILCVTGREQMCGFYQRQSRDFQGVCVYITRYEHYIHECIFQNVFLKIWRMADTTFW